MIRAVTEEAVALASIALFAGMIVGWAQIFAAPAGDAKLAREKQYASHRLR